MWQPTKAWDHYALFIWIVFALFLLFPAHLKALTFKNIGAGGAGAFLDVVGHPTNAHIMFFATDVAGVFRTLDGAKTFEKMNLGLTTAQIHTVEIVAEANNSSIVFLATTDGVYRSLDLGRTWQLKDSGFFTIGPPGFGHPVRDVKVSPSNHNIVWASLGEAINPSINTRERSDKFVVYKSTDGGDNWQGVLNTEKKTSELWTTLAVHPTNPDYAVLGSDRGLYVTLDGGASWQELGKQEIKQTKDGGMTWQICSAQNPCPPQLSGPTCTHGVNCLPIAEDVGDPNETKYPWVRDVKFHVTQLGETFLYVVLHDDGHLNDPACNRARFDDGLLRKTGGPYRSKDGGVIWERLFDPLDSPKAFSTLLRCNETVPLPWNGTYYREIEIDPNDPDHYVLSAFFLLAGVREHLNGRWINVSATMTGNRHTGIDNMCYPSADVNDPFAVPNCFEGGKSIDMWNNQNGPSTYSLAVPDWPDGRPHILMASSRGVREGRYDPLNDWFFFDHLHADPDVDNPGYWRGRGLDDYCPADMVWLDSEADLLVSGGDSAIIKSKNGGRSWKLFNEGAAVVDESKAIVYDEVSGLIYAARFVTRQVFKNNVATIPKTEEQWTVIGGYCGDDCTAPDNGLPKKFRMADLAIDYSSPVNARRILAGTDFAFLNKAAGEKTSDGLYVYDPAAAQGSQWSKVDHPSCPGTENTRAIHKVLTSPVYPDFAIITSKDYSSNILYRGVDSSFKTGIYLVNLKNSPIDCIHIVNPDPTVGLDVRAPHDVILARLPNGDLSLVVAGARKWKPVIYQTSFDFANPQNVNWQIAADFASLSLLAGFNETDITAFARKDFITLAVSPRDPTLVLAGMFGNPFFDHYTPQHIYVSRDGGGTFDIAREFDTFPEHNMRFIKFSPFSNRLYIGASCSSLYMVKNPFIDTSQDDLDCYKPRSTQNVATTWYQDKDGDGEGNPAVTKQSCSQHAGYVSNSLDCNDTDASINSVSLGCVTVSKPADTSKIETDIPIVSSEEAGQAASTTKKIIGCQLNAKSGMVSVNSIYLFYAGILLLMLGIRIGSSSDKAKSSPSTQR